VGRRRRVFAGQWVVSAVGSVLPDGPGLFAVWVARFGCGGRQGQEAIPPKCVLSPRSQRQKRRLSWEPALGESGGFGACGGCVDERRLGGEPAPVVSGGFCCCGGSVLLKTRPKRELPDERERAGNRGAALVSWLLGIGLNLATLLITWLVQFFCITSMQKPKACRPAKSTANPVRGALRSGQP